PLRPRTPNLFPYTTLFRSTAHRLLATTKSAEWLRGQRLRKRLAEALQAVHQRGNVHITTRELRGALSYILFGVLSCRELHDHSRSEEHTSELQSPDQLVCR